MNSQAAALIVHDIKNALAVLEGELHALSLEPERERAAHAWRRCGALREKLIGFLTLYKAGSGGLRARVEPLCPEDFLRTLLADTLHAREGVQVRIEGRDMPQLAFFDEHLVALALEAALQNALRFAKSAVALGCRPGEEGGVVFWVGDDGTGLGAQSACPPSTGLGTELCRAVAEAHRNRGRSGWCTLVDGAAGGALFELHLP